MRDVIGLLPVMVIVIKIGGTLVRTARLPHWPDSYAIGPPLWSTSLAKTIDNVHTLYALQVTLTKAIQTEDRKPSKSVHEPEARVVVTQVDDLLLGHARQAPSFEVLAIFQILLP